MHDLNNKVALVSGGGSGIGEASCERLAASGAAVVVTDINGETAERTANVIRQRGGKAIAFAQDVTVESRWAEVLDGTIAEFGRLDVLVNNAGISGAGGTDSLDIGDFDGWRRVMDLNLDAVYLACKEAIAYMKDEGGSIINMSSVMGLVGGAGPAYNASKGGVRLLTKSIAVYCGNAGYPVRCNSIHPGFIWTPLVRDIVNHSEEYKTEEELHDMLVMRHPIGRLGEADDIAKGVCFLASEDSAFMTGSELVIDGGYTAV